VPVAEFDKAKQTIEAAKDKIGFASMEGYGDVVKVSVIGVGMRSHAGVAATASEIKISILIDAAYTELAVRTLHSVYGLDG